MKNHTQRPASRGKKPLNPVVTIAIFVLAIGGIIGLGVYYLNAANPRSTFGSRPMGGNKTYLWRNDVVNAWEKEVTAAKKQGRQPDMRRKPLFGPYGNMNAPWKNGFPTQTGGTSPQNMPMPGIPPTK